MKRIVTSAAIRDIAPLNDRYYLLHVALDKPFPELPQPGQFIQLQASSAGAFLPRPLSICDYNAETAMLTLLVQQVGKASKFWLQMPLDSTLRLVGPLGKGFTLDKDFSGERPILIGGGVGVAPLLMLARALCERGVRPTILLGARTSKMLVLRELFAEYGELALTTDDGSMGEVGNVLGHSVLQKQISAVYTCGPMRMMQAVAHWAGEKKIPCEVSLENKMACGIGVCLCCVTPTQAGNKCVCSEGPVFRASLLLDFQP